MTSRKPCINVTTTTYTGKELSPLHNGLSAEGYDLDTVMEGFDKLMWITKIKNNRKVWVRYSIPNRMAHEHQEKEANEQKKNEDQEIVKETEDNKISDETQDIAGKKLEDIPVVICMPIEKTVMKRAVEEKKLTAYNMFLTYRLQEQKKHYSTINVTKSNKEVFNEVIQQWKSLDKKSEEYVSIMKAAEDYSRITKS